ncbi:unnamed protein product [Cylindrotheca closterium]|uniref:Uncharacterized protein n=1 Tax=Cylindrotheca closterium TaxID=2856 RepID=A0AAD2GB98_9STRA|nr:unnamed protein product [Cylindrotheca closterium]
MKFAAFLFHATIAVSIHDASSFAPSLRKHSVVSKPSSPLNSVLTRTRPTPDVQVLDRDDFPIKIIPGSSVVSKNDGSPLKIIPARSLISKKGFSKELQLLDESPLDFPSLSALSENELSKDLQLLDETVLSIPSLSEISEKVSRPSKKKVSLHSVLGSTAIGTSIIAILPHLALSLRDNITCLNLAVDAPFHLTQLHLANFQLVLLMLTGMLRLPKKAGKARTSIFQCIACGMASNFVMGLSNLMGPGSPHLIDAWTWPGRILIGGTGIASSLGIANLYHDVITGPLKGREPNPLFENRLLGLFSTTKYCLSFAFQIALMVPMFAPKATFDSFTAPLLQACGATIGTLTMGKFINNFYLAMGALCATFQYEKRASRKSCNIALASVAFFSLWDIYKYLFQFVRAAVLQEAGPKLAFVKYLGTIEKSFPVMTLWFLPIVLAIGHGAITAVREKRYHLPEIDWCHPRRLLKLAGL